jgi:hypothetical protein
MPQVRGVVPRAAAQDYRLSAIVSGIVASDAFRMQGRPDRRDVETKASGAIAKKN